eukprot:CAMPEP_0172658252 /NCGR_PEP_ID=MMETSP1074-20121228/2665_1 /TAXON_ID=2916 /ORGANISM="Ceratium fusus, Strain PA161109" /LENGTH=423 /DNA_ID=CAMNT_0013473521 /DNA_START=127 /DNA_END=1398 /DNA_ORIENTATION=+
MTRKGHKLSEYRVKNKSGRTVTLMRKFSEGRAGPFGELAPQESIPSGDDHPFWCMEIEASVNGIPMEKWTRSTQQDDFGLKFSRSQSTAVSQERVAEVTERLREVRAMKAEDELSRQVQKAIRPLETGDSFAEARETLASVKGTGETRFWTMGSSSSSKRELPPRSARKRQLRQGPMTSLLAQQAPDAASTVLPLFQHDKYVAGCQNVEFMSLSRMAKDYGNRVMEAVYDAFRNFTLAESGGSFVGMPLDTVIRHGFALYVIFDESDKVPSEALDALLSPKERSSQSGQDRLIRGILDPEHMEARDDMEARAAFYGSSDGTHRSVTVVAFACCTAMDIWHRDNDLSPGHRDICEKLGGRKSRHKKKGKPVQTKVEVSLPDDPDKALQLLRDQESKEQEFDQEFAALSFDDVLRQEKEQKSSGS